MDQRKLIKLGNSSFAIALPKDWIDKSGLKKGDNIFVIPNSNGELIIGSKYNKDKTSKFNSLDLKDEDETSLQVELISSYLRDYDTLKIKNNLDIKQKKHVKDLVKNLMSFEIIEENQDEIILKDLFNLDEADIKSFVRRIDNILRSFFEDIITAVKSGKINKELSKEIQVADVEITRLYLLIGRIFMKSLDNPSMLHSIKTNSLDLFRNWWIALHLEKVGDELKRVAKILENPIKADNKFLIGLFDEINKNYIGCVSSYYSNNKQMNKEVIGANQKIISTCEKYDGKDAIIAQIVEKFKYLQGNVFQISKMMAYTMN